MQTNGAPGADRVAAAVAWLTAAGMAVFSVLEQALPDTACWMCYAAAILFLVPLTLHSMKFAAVAFQNIERRTYVSYGHAPLSFAIAVVAVVYLPFRATASTLAPAHFAPDTRYDARLSRAQMLLYLSTAVSVLALIVDSTRAGMCLALPAAEVLAIAVLGVVGWIYWRPAPSAAEAPLASTLPDDGLA
jgi:hypothetical protein